MRDRFYSTAQNTDRFHGRHADSAYQCEAPGCEEAGEYRAPGHRPSGFDGPGNARWFCLDHVREFNAGYDWFEGMSAEEVQAAQSPIAGWASESPAFRTDAGIDGLPRWANFRDPLDAIGERAKIIKNRAGQHASATYANSRFNQEETGALQTLGLNDNVTRHNLRRRYSELVRRYHPDRNGGDRQYEARLTRVVEAYQLLRKSASLI